VNNILGKFEFGWQQGDPSFTANGLNLEALAKIEPEVYVSMKDKAWELRFVSNFGSPPNEMYIRIDAATGVVLDYAANGHKLSF
jgi:hypothetical protein